MAPEEQKTFQFWNAMDKLEESEALSTSKYVGREFDESGSLKGGSLEGGSNGWC